MRHSEDEPEDYFGLEISGVAVALGLLAIAATVGVLVSIAYAVFG